jgi:hypothetical protein
LGTIAKELDDFYRRIGGGLVQTTKRGPIFFLIFFFSSLSQPPGPRLCDVDCTNIVVDRLRSDKTG